VRNFPLPSTGTGARFDFWVARIKNVAPLDSHQALLDKYLAHGEIVKNQTGQVKKDKENLAPNAASSSFEGP